MEVSEIKRKRARIVRERGGKEIVREKEEERGNCPRERERGRK